MIVLAVFQRIVDWSQKHPHWWCRQCSIGMTITYVFAELFRAGPWGTWRTVACVVNLACFTLYFRDSRSAASVSRWGQTWLIAMFWAFGVVRILVTSTPEGAAYAVSILFTALYVTFAACRPPAPPKHRAPAAMPQGGSA